MKSESVIVIFVILALIAAGAGYFYYMRTEEKELAQQERQALEQAMKEAQAKAEAEAGNQEPVKEPEKNPVAPEPVAEPEPVKEPEPAVEIPEPDVPKEAVEISITDKVLVKDCVRFGINLGGDTYYSGAALLKKRSTRNFEGTSFRQCGQ